MFAFIMFACVAKDNALLATNEVAPIAYITSNTLSNGDIEQVVDIDQDGKADVWNFLHPRKDNVPLLFEKRVDINNDGKPDIWSFYGDDGQLKEEHFDTNFDTLPDIKEYYKTYAKKSRLVSSIIDTDGDGIANTSRQIRKQNLYLLKKDTTGDGKLDLWQALDNGRVEKYCQDVDGDEVFDVREE